MEGQALRGRAGGGIEYEGQLVANCWRLNLEDPDRVGRSAQVEVVVGQAARLLSGGVAESDVRDKSAADVLFCGEGGGPDRGLGRGGRGKGEETGEGEEHARARAHRATPPRHSARPGTPGVRRLPDSAERGAEAERPSGRAPGRSRDTVRVSGRRPRGRGGRGVGRSGDP